MNDVIDKTVFAELQDTAGPEFVQELVGTFLEEAPGLMAELRAARDAAQADSFRRAAHSLKSNSQTFGALRLAEAARSLELAGLSADPEYDRQAIVALQAALDEAATALRELARG
ncbi:MAG: Hpt domain-containing protein [Rubrivivax sp.]|nr:Hpt domain-containing protein [Rubrivivax sp.]MDP3222156.1 Hpt domain-containing protein [Rubrivivax sp.]MDP3613855.1 Hpt domain-containing protein [Rubrivivax sp.]